MLQTNPREVREAVGPILPHFLIFEVAFVYVYMYLIQRLPKNIMGIRTALAICICSSVVLFGVTYYKNGLFYTEFRQIGKRDLILQYDYPFSFLSGVIDARNFLKKNNLTKAESFSFGAVKNDTLKQRQVYVLIIGESSRYDRWQVNGYHRETSPRLSSVRDLLAYSNVVSGAHYTWVSVPQIITRANPDNYDAQFREKSILRVFQEAGFYTYWLSNQSDQDIFWSGSITLHARTADYYKFSPTYSPNLEFENIYDGRLIPLLDSVLRADKRNLFIVLHTMGNHWEYSRRYPPEFNVFNPSATLGTMPEGRNREAILNSYDNSVLYADYIIHSVIEMVDRSAEISAVTFVSDHGEDLFDNYQDRLDFHFRPSAATLRVPLFVWTSDSYNKFFPEKRGVLESNVSRKIGAENLFYTVADIANIRLNDFDSTRSFAHPSFIDSEQKFYGDEKKARRFVQLPLASK